MTAVAVWDHEPGDDELLAARLAAGWTPRATALADGERVLGHASCLVGHGRAAGRSSPMPGSRGSGESQG